MRLLFTFSTVLCFIAVFIGFRVQGAPLQDALQTDSDVDIQQDSEVRRNHVSDDVDMGIDASNPTYNHPSGILYSWGFSALGHGEDEEETAEPKPVTLNGLMNKFAVLRCGAGGQHTVLLACRREIDGEQTASTAASVTSAPQVEGDGEEEANRGRLEREEARRREDGVVEMVDAEEEEEEEA
ncbi:hypothetical protein HK102_012864 [Quaeritorhiza haematococci]|nr:hypothetical protein HK102_012864 [Quaeritorhiza haematococci]